MSLVYLVIIQLKIFLQLLIKPYEHPVRTNQIPRQVPDQIWYMNPIISTLMAGVLPFGAMFIELYFIFSVIFMTIAKKNLKSS